ncbi:SseB family protein [uncultured Amnibacterium sp.]|uniref:SseB family protein n=1 Tax=uncultured Amnibacterium sp. TaxID=1631851 RepID=UPI0035CB2362
MSTDSAGRPWAGRAFETSPWAGDDGTAPAAYSEVLAAFRAGRAEVEAVVDALRGVRLLVPLLAEVGEVGETASGSAFDRKAELALVTVAGPDGRRVLPAFSSAAAMSAWNPQARPVPAPARQIALGAAADGTELVVVDPATERFGLRRGALEALARDLPWTAPWHDPEVGVAIRMAVADEPAVTTARVGTDDPRASLDGAEVQIVVVLHETLDRQQVGELMARVQRRWTEDEIVRTRVDSMTVRLEADPFSF